MSLRELIVEQIRTRGPLTVAEYMALALYHPDHGYYARADRRSGRAGDFFTSVDVGPLFGQLLAVQFAEMWRIVGGRTDGTASGSFDIVEAGAGNGQLSADVLDAVAASAPEFYDAIRLQLVEPSSCARAAQPKTLGRHAAKLTTSAETLPDGVTGVLFANELLDALPTHRVVMARHGLCEVYVDEQDGRLVERNDPPSTPELAVYLNRLGVELAVGSRAEVNLAALAWIREAARRLRRGFLLIIDYGFEARDLYGSGRTSGSLAAYRQHMVSHPAASTTPSVDATDAWLAEPGQWDLTAHIDLTSIKQAAEQHGLQVLGVLDQTYFLLGLGAAEHAASTLGDGVPEIKQRLAAKTLLMPGGLGSTQKVLLFGKEVGTPALRGCSFRPRLT